MKFYFVLNQKIYILILLCLVLFSFSPLMAETKVDVYGPLPIKAPIYDIQKQKIAKAYVYFKYVEIFKGNTKLLRVGIMSNKGAWELFLVKNDANKSLVGYANKGIVYTADHKKIAGYYVITPTFLYVYNPKRDKVGSSKCIAWQHMCAAAVASYLLHLI